MEQVIEQNYRASYISVAFNVASIAVLTIAAFVEIEQTVSEREPRA